MEDAPPAAGAAAADGADGAQQAGRRRPGERFGGWIDWPRWAVLVGSLVIGRIVVGLGFGARVTWGLDTFAVLLLVPLLQMAAVGLTSGRTSTAPPRTSAGGGPRPGFSPPPLGRRPGGGGESGAVSRGSERVDAPAPRSESAP